MTDFTRFIITLLAIALVVVIVAITLPVNFQLFVLSEGRASIQKDANQRGWDEYLVECWNSNLEGVQEVANASSYGNFLVNTTSTVRTVVVFAEFAFCFALIFGIAYIWEPKKY